MFDSVLYDFLLCLILFLSLIYLFLKERYGYFKRRGLPYEEPMLFLGNTWRNVLGMENLVDSVDRIYRNNRDKPFIGVFQGLIPSFLLVEPRLVRKVLIEEFSHFTNRGLPFDEVANPLEGHLFNMTDNKWKTLRNKLTPCFSSGKLKGMMPLLLKSVQAFVDNLENQLNKEIEMKSTFSRLNLHVIGTCAFGLNLDTITNPDSEFPKVCKRIFVRDPATFVKGVVRFFFPAIAKIFRFRMIPKETHDFFTNLVKDSFDHRLKTGTKRNDLLQLLLELREKGEIHFDARDMDEEDVQHVRDTVADNGTLVLTDEVLTAQAFVFFSAGFETTSTTLSFIFYLLSKHQSVQDKLREEIMRTKGKFGSFNYESLKNMPYTEACIKESMRLYSPVGLLIRKCNKDVEITPGVKVERGNLMLIPVHSIQRDHVNYPDPLTFKPERFLKSSPSACSYLPFGDGPRICIAQRFANIVLRLAVAEILSKYKVDTCATMSSHEPIKLLPRAFITIPKDGIHCVFTKINQ